MIQFKPSKNPKVLKETLEWNRRTIDLDCVRRIERDGKMFCGWCCEVEIFKKNQKYCSNVCQKSAWAWAYPQKEESLGFLLIDQNFKCRDCELDYTIYMNQICERERKKYPNTPKIDWGDCESWQWKRVKAACELNHRPEIDHIHPIFKNGSPLERGNLQVLCNSCHKKKTAKDKRVQGG